MQRRRRHESSSIEELENLAVSAGYTVVGRLEQIRHPDYRYQIGAGKVEELARLVKENEAQKVIFDNPLRPVQSYNLAKATGVEVIDRFQLILEIFSKRATTTEAQMQIKLARLRYELAQAKEKVRLAKKGEQPGFMGLGAYEVDIYYESVKKEIHTILKKLKKIRVKRVLHRARRAKLDFQMISLAGYTKAGKSSLFNALTDETVPVDESLFTTLSTTTRLLEISRKRFLLTDTVGFIDRLPLTLVEAFRSTLEETIYSDLIILVVDISEPTHVVNKKLSVCLETLEQIEASGIPMLTALNKIDLVPAEELAQKIKALEDKAVNPVPISALRKINIDKLEEKILELLQNYVSASLTLPMSGETMAFMSWLHKVADVRKIEYREDSAQLLFEASPGMAENIRRLAEKLNGKLEKIE
ncbi:GTPase HflX [Candidatus Bathyarchaeota archaeon]|nr:GTPase HflX [Candidatus Bathyarchaeota archaeon]